MPAEKAKSYKSPRILTTINVIRNVAIPHHPVPGTTLKDASRPNVKLAPPSRASQAIGSPTRDQSVLHGTHVGSVDETKAARGSQASGEDTPRWGTGRVCRGVLSPGGRLLLL
jgi:hypothetical protein